MSRDTNQSKFVGRNKTEAGSAAIWPPASQYWISESTTADDCGVGRLRRARGVRDG